MPPAPFAIIGSLFALVCVVCFNLSHTHIALFFATIAVLFFIIGIFLHFKKGKKTKTKINLQDFTFIDPPGYYTHPDYSYWICPYCLINKNRISPVSKVDDDAWYCNVCDKPLSGSKGAVFSLDDE